MIEIGHLPQTNCTWKKIAMTLQMTCLPHNTSHWQFPDGSCQYTKMRTPINASGHNSRGMPGRDQTQSQLPWTQEQNNHRVPNHHTEQLDQNRVNKLTNDSTTIKTNSNPFYTSWGDHLPTIKQPNTIWLVIQDFGGWPQWNNNPKTRSCDNT